MDFSAGKRAALKRIEEQITREVTAAISLQVRDISAVLSQLFVALTDKGVLERDDVRELLARSERLVAEAAERSGRENRHPLLIPNLRKILLDD